MKQREPYHDNWATPPYFYNKLDKIYKFNFDPCPFNHDLSLWDGLKIEWGERNYINPPYSLKLKEAFVTKAIEESKKGKLCVMLLPVSTSTKLFHNVIKPNARMIDFQEGRIPFIGSNNLGQKVNYHLIQEVTDETIEIVKKSEIDGEPIIKKIPLYVKNSGMHDSMVVTFF